MSLLVQDFLEHSARLLPGKVALVCNGARLTYHDVNTRANRIANALARQGVRRGDRVVVFLPNTVDAVTSIFGILKAGGVFVPVNRTTKPGKLLYILNNCGASALITDPRALANGELERLNAEAASLHTIVVADGPPPRDCTTRCVILDAQEIQAQGPAEAPPRNQIDLDLACLIYTSGTTGDPKGVMSDHGNVVFASGSIIHYLGNLESDVVLNVLPLSFDYGLYQLLMTFRFGGTLVLENSFAFPAEILRRIAEERVTGFPGVPTIFAMLLRMDLSAFDLSSLRYISNTAAALPASHIVELRGRFPGVTVFSMYGLTETKRTLYLPPDQVDQRPGSVGIAIPGTEVWLEDDSGRRLGPGEVGQLVVRGRHVMRGYWGADEASAARFRPGPLPGERLCYTGDLFRSDEEGFLYFVGRRDDMLKSRGEKVAPKEVEAALHSLPGVVEAAVVGVPDPLLGHRIKAVVVKSDPSLTDRAVLAHCRKLLEDFMMPQVVEFRDALPKSPSGKVRKEELV